MRRRLSNESFTSYRTFRIVIVAYVMYDCCFVVDVPAIHTATTEGSQSLDIISPHTKCGLVLLLHERWNNIWQFMITCKRAHHRVYKALRIILHRHQAGRGQANLVFQDKRKEMHLYLRTGSTISVMGFPLTGHVMFRRGHWVLVITMSSSSSPGIGSPAWWTFCRQNIRFKHYSEKSKRKADRCMI